MSKEKLKPCPFCGGKAEMGLNFGRVGVSCTKCDANFRSGSICSEVGYDSVIEAWNTRTKTTNGNDNANEIFKPILDRLCPEKAITENKDVQSLIANTVKLQAENKELCGYYTKNHMLKDEAIDKDRRIAELEGKLDAEASAEKIVDFLARTILQYKYDNTFNWDNDDVWGIVVRTIISDKYIEDHAISLPKKEGKS